MEVPDHLLVCGWNHPHGGSLTIIHELFEGALQLCWDCFERSHADDLNRFDGIQSRFGETIAANFRPDTIRTNEEIRFDDFSIPQGSSTGRSVVIHDEVVKLSPEVNRSRLELTSHLAHEALPLNSLATLQGLSGMKVVVQVVDVVLPDYVGMALSLIHI